MQHTLESLQPVFWQYLLSAELPAYKSNGILKDLLESSFDPISFLFSHPSLTEAEKKRMRAADVSAFERAMEQGVFVFNPSYYPKTLRQCPFPPPALFAKGDLEIFSRPLIAIVGTRKATNYGRSVAHRFAQRFVQAGAVLVSGGAYGIDTVAHKSALDANGHTVAVLPTGIDQYYPSANTLLFERIASKGCLLSPFAVNARFHPARPLFRNQIIAAISQVVVVIEAPAKSGALTTAIAANDLSRDVFVVPANIDNPNFAGSHMLIREGATLVDNPDQVLDAMGIKGQQTLFGKLEAANPLQLRILELLKIEPMPLEKIIEMTQVEASVVLSELTLLEIEGRVLRDFSGYSLG